jgi:ferritin-like metal-binding protein YciE
MPNTKTRKSARSSETATQSRTYTAAEQGTQLEKFFHDQLRDIYWAEKHLVKALPKMAKAATTEDLASAIDDHLAQTEEHVTRLEQVFETFGKKPSAKKCDGMEGLLKEGDSCVEETEEGSMTRDAAIIMSAQKVEHYEVATYGTLVQLARTMGREEIAELLEKTLNEEKQADLTLTQIAESCINVEAQHETESESQQG